MDAHGYNQYNLEASFRNYLLAENISADSTKNYLSDFRHFMGWFSNMLSVQGISEPNFETLTSYLSADTIRDYKNYLTGDATPLKTTNRRLSTVRKFCSFCITQGWLTTNPAKQIENELKVPNHGKKDFSHDLKIYEYSLQQSKIKSEEIKNRIADVEEFLTITSS